MENRYPKIVCWRITSKCNRKCSFCFRPNRKELNTKEVCKIIDKLAACGVKGIGVTGGEPLLRKDIVKILKHIWEKDIKICLATNTDFYFKYQKFINKYVSAIGIPIEGSKREIHDLIRGDGSFCNVINTINKICTKSRLKMYFSTVLTKDNIDDLANMENLLAKYKDKVLYWKIYDIIDYSNRPFQSVKSNKIPKIKIKKIVNVLGKKLGKEKIFYLSPADRSEASFLINPNGEALIPVNKKTKTTDFILGNLSKNEVSQIFMNWNKATDYNKYKCHKCALKCLGLKDEPAHGA